MLNTFFQVIDWNTSSRRQVEQFLKEVVKHSSYLPRYLFLEGITRVGTNPIGGGGFSDVWKGDLGGEIVALKVLRAYIDDNSRSALEQIHKVCDFTPLTYYCRNLLLTWTSYEGILQRGNDLATATTS